MKALAAQAAAKTAESHTVGKAVSIAAGSAGLATIYEVLGPALGVVASIVAISVGVLTFVVKWRKERRETIEFNERHGGVK